MQGVNIIIPAHNEATSIIDCVQSLYDLYHEGNTITVATDGNTDDTDKILMNYIIKENLDHVFVQSYPERIGKGAAIKLALLQGYTNIFYDADMAVSPHALHAMYELACSRGGIVTAKRYAPERKKTRSLLSFTYNSMVRLLFRTGITDHQCGCKVLSPEATAIAEQIKADDFFFDTELIVKCKRAGLPVTKYSVYWVEHKKKSSVSLCRDSLRMFGQLLKLRFA